MCTCMRERIEVCVCLCVCSLFPGDGRRFRDVFISIQLLHSVAPWGSKRSDAAVRVGGL